MIILFIFYGGLVINLADFDTTEACMAAEKRLNADYWEFEFRTECLAGGADMTTIAWDGKILAADSQGTAAGAIEYYHNTKIKRLKSGAVMASCGDRADGFAVQSWIDGKSDKPVVSDGFEAIVIEKGKAKVLVHPSLHPYPVKPPYAVGSGWRWALAAMDHGKNAPDAIRYAKTRDVNTGGRVRTART